ncbi:DUF3566 domain-containing protein [Aeromicrobium duanguangcaii]|uniref:DUF3566 domain-containing protein n=1 Tax=Aeromicrobium duanguangcaii TaxID=2968086 RepID=UPI00201776AD|nr:DUF3566 domain-containing protein [Aeromicrobium duanguangcaii]
MTDQKPGDGQQNGTPHNGAQPNGVQNGAQPNGVQNGAKSNGTGPTVSARRPLSKAEYARTTKATPDATAVIPAVRDDQPAPGDAKAPAGDDRPTQTFKAVPREVPEKKPAPKPPKKADKPAAKQQPTAEPAESRKPAAGAAAAGAAGAAASAPTAPAPKAPTPPLVPRPGEKKTAPVTKTAPVAPSKPGTSSTTSTAAAADSGTTRSAQLKVKHIDPWSVTKMAFVVSVALMVVSVVAVTVFWLVMQITGVWGSLNDSVSNVLADDASGFDVTDYLGFGRVVGLTLLVSSLNVIFMSALATIAAHLYNLAAGILGGIEVTFGERR